MRRVLATVSMLVPIGPVGASAADRVQATLYKNPQCGCCEGHADHLRAKIFELTDGPTRVYAVE